MLLRDGMRSFRSVRLLRKAGFFYAANRSIYMSNAVRTLVVSIVAALALSACGSAPSGQLPASNADAPAAAPPSGTTVALITAATVVPAPASAEVATPAATVVVPVSATHTVVDSLGRSVLLRETPRRIVSLAPSVTEILFAVGAGPQVVGDTRFCNYPSEAKGLPKIGGYTAKTINIEAVVDLTPDLVIAGTASQKPVVEALEKLNIPVLVLAPGSFEAVYTGIKQIGAVTNHAQEAEAMVVQMRTRVDAVTAKVATVPADRRPSVFWEVFDAPLTTAGPNTFIGQMIQLAGATNIFGDAREDYPQVSAELVVERNPDIILGPTTQSTTLTPDLVAQRPGWAKITALRNGRIYLLDNDMTTRAGPRLVDALEALAKALYPELFA
jgi:iron complex transport system substrate-binding protein